MTNDEINTEKNQEPDDFFTDLDKAYESLRENQAAWLELEAERAQLDQFLADSPF